MSKASMKSTEGIANAFRNLFYPAAAGNVGWSFLSLVVQLSVHDASRSTLQRLWGALPFLSVLLLLFIYLTTEWINTIGRTASLKFWLADGALLIAIVVFAISVQVTGSSWQFWSLFATLLFAAIGNFVFWRRGNEGWRAAIWRCVGNVLALVVLIVTRNDWRLPAAVLLAFVAYRVLMSREASRDSNAERSDRSVVATPPEAPSQSNCDCS